MPSLELLDLRRRQAGQQTIYATGIENNFICGYNGGDPCKLSRVLVTPIL
jgi:hypothetical protein